MDETASTTPSFYVPNDSQTDIISANTSEQKAISGREKYITTINTPQSLLAGLLKTLMYTH